MGKKGKGYFKGRDHFEAVASGKVEGSGSKYAQKVTGRIKGERSDVVEPAKPLQGRFEKGADMPVTPPAAVQKNPLEKLKETGAMMTDAYFFGASRPVVTAHSFGLNMPNPPFFPAVEDEAFKNKPCRLIAICHDDGDYTGFHTWTLRRVVGTTGRNFQDIQLSSRYSQMHDFLETWEKGQSGANRTTATLPEGVKAALVSSLDYGDVLWASRERRELKPASNDLNPKIL